MKPIRELPDKSTSRFDISKGYTNLRPNSNSASAYPCAELGSDLTVCKALGKIVSSQLSGNSSAQKKK